MKTVKTLELTVFLCIQLLNFIYVQNHLLTQLNSYQPNNF